LCFLHQKSNAIIIKVTEATGTTTATAIVPAAERPPEPCFDCVVGDGVDVVLDVVVDVPPNATGGFVVVVGLAVEVKMTVVATLLKVEGGIVSAKVVDGGGIMNDEKLDEVPVLPADAEEVLVEVGRNDVDVGRVEVDAVADELRGGADEP
jgi:hypothetical protein